MISWLHRKLTRHRNGGLLRQEPYNTLLPTANTPNKHRLLIGTPTTGLCRMEWAYARFGAVMPCNWSAGSFMAKIPSMAPLNFGVADAQNVICAKLMEIDAKWLCFRGDTIVEVDSGGKKIRDVSVGDLVKTHLGNWRRVVKTMKRPIRQGDPLLWVKTAHSTIKCTDEHPFLVASDDGGHVWKQAERLRPGDHLVYPSPIGTPDVVELGLTFNTVCSGYNNLKGGSRNTQVIDAVVVGRAWARFLGLYLAEGHCDKDGIALTFHNGEADYIDFVIKFFSDTFSRKPTVCRSWATQLRLNIRHLSPIFKGWFGERARVKRIPPFVFGWSIVNKLEFLKGYLDGDGRFTSAGICCFGTASKQLADDVVRLGRSCGLTFSRVYSNPPKESVMKNGHVIKSTGSYSATIGKKSVGKMLDILDGRQTGDCRLVPVESVERHYVSTRLTDWFVYNLEVEDDNSYIADSVAVHNCLLEQDNVIPPDFFVRLNQYIRDEDVPIVSGLYFTKSVPAEPMVYRGRGTSYYQDWKIGDKVWCDGCPTGCLLIHSSIIRVLWEESEPYMSGGTIQTRKVFTIPEAAWADPEKGWQTHSGTSDLEFCSRVIVSGAFKKAGWSAYADKRWPMLVDTNILTPHVREDGVSFPSPVELDYWKKPLAERKGHG